MDSNIRAGSSPAFSTKTRNNYYGFFCSYLCLRFGTEIVNFIQNNIIMKQKLLFLSLLISSFVFSQTTHQYPWNMQSTNQTINIEIGDTVVWTWGSGTHNLISTGGVEAFDSGYHGQGHVFSHTFNMVGSTTFTCSPHASMYGVVNVTDPLSVNEYNIIQLDVYPNPAIDIVNIKLNTLNEDADLEIYNMLGKVVMQKSYDFNAESLSIDVSQLTTGIYILKVSNSESTSYKRFIKK